MEADSCGYDGRRADVIILLPGVRVEDTFPRMHGGIAVYTRLAFASSTSSWLTAVARDEASEAQSCSLPRELQIYRA